MSRRRGGWLVLAWIVVATALRAQPPTVAGTMPEDFFPALQRILQSATRQAPIVLERQLELERAEAGVLIADSVRWPHLGGNVRYENSSAAISGSNDSRTDRGAGLFGGVEFNQPLFHWGALKNEGARARLQAAMAERNYQEAYRQLAIEVRRQFLLLVAKKAELVQMRAQQRLNVEDHRLTKEQFERGLATEGDVFGRQVTMEENAWRVERSEAEFEAMRRTLGRISGVGRIGEDEIPAEIPEVAITPELTSRLLGEVMRDAVSSSFEVQVLELQARDADLNYRIQRVRNLPKFSAGASYALENTTNATTNSVSQQGVERQSFGIRADWSIFDGFETRGRKRDAAAAKRLAQQRLNSRIEAIQEEAQRLARQVALEARGVQLAERQRSLAAGDVGRAENEVKLGNTPPSTVELARVRLYGRQVDDAVARATLLRVWSEFVSLVGLDPMLKNLPVRHAR